MWLGKPERVFQEEGRYARGGLNLGSRSKLGDLPPKRGGDTRKEGRRNKIEKEKRNGLPARVGHEGKNATKAKVGTYADMRKGKNGEEANSLRARYFKRNQKSSRRSGNRTEGDKVGRGKGQCWQCKKREP